MRILITAIGSFSADIVINNLKKEKNYVVGCDIYNKEWLATSLDVDTFYQVPYATKKDEYIKFIRELCIKEKIDLIMPLTDIEVDIYNDERTWFSENNIIVCISSKETIDICRNKKKAEEFINKNIKEINTIPTVCAKDIINSPFKYPIVCKLINGRSSQGLIYIYNEEEWILFCSKPNKGQYIIQPFIKGNIVTCDVIMQKDNNKVVSIMREELLRTMNGAGTSVHVYNDSLLQKSCKKLAEGLNITGCVNFEFIKNDERYYFIECNPRFSGGVKFSCIAGYDFIVNHMKCFIDEDIDNQPKYKNQFIARKYEEKITYMEEE